MEFAASAALLPHPCAPSEQQLAFKLGLPTPDPSTSTARQRLPVRTAAFCILTNAKDGLNIVCGSVRRSSACWCARPSARFPRGAAVAPPHPLAFSAAIDNAPCLKPASPNGAQFRSARWHWRRASAPWTLAQIFSDAWWSVSPPGRET